MDTTRAQRSGRAYAARRALAFWQLVFLGGCPAALTEAGPVGLGKNKCSSPVPDEPTVIFFFLFPNLGPDTTATYFSHNWELNFQMCQSLALLGNLISQNKNLYLIP